VTPQSPDARFQPEFLRPVPLLAPDYRGSVEALVHKDLEASSLRFVLSTVAEASQPGRSKLPRVETLARFATVTIRR
jgi:hypothetical protein